MLEKLVLENNAGEKYDINKKLCLDLLVEKHYQRLLNFLMGLVANREEAEDLVQEAFARTIEKWETFEGRADPSTWLFSIAINLHRDNFRKEKRKGKVFIESSSNPKAENLDPSQYPDTRVNAPDKNLILSEEEKIIKKAVSELPAKLREVVSLHYYGHFSYQEIAAICGCPVGTVGSRLNYAVRILREKLSSFFIEKGN